MDTAREDQVPLFGTWQPAPGFEPNRISFDPEDTVNPPMAYSYYAGGYTGRPRTTGTYRGTFNRTPMRQSRQPYRKTTHQSYNFQKQQGRESYWSVTGPRTEIRKIAGNSVEFPVIAPSKAPPEDKTLILEQTKDKIEEIGSCDWTTKAQLLAQRFVTHVPTAAAEAKTRISKLNDWSSNAFSFGRSEAIRADFETGSLHHTQSLRYLSLEIKIDPAKALSNSLKVPNVPTDRSILAYLKVPLNENQTGTSDLYSYDDLKTGENMITALKRNNHPIVFGRTNYDGAFDTLPFEVALRNIKSECEFRVIFAILHREYIGKVTQTDLDKRLRDCRQILWEAGKFRMKSIDEQHADFMRLVMEFDITTTFPVNLTNIAFHNLSKEIQDQLTETKYKPPTERGDNEEQFQQLAIFAEKAKEAELKLKTLSSLIKRTQIQQNRNTPTAFMISPEEFGLARERSSSPWDPTCHSFKSSVQSNWSPDQFQDHEDFEEIQEDWSPEQDIFHSMTMFSIAERAMRKSSGERAPMACWGCGDMPKYKEGRFHRYANCPNRRDPEVRKNFEKNFQEHLKKRRKPSPYGPSSKEHPRDKEEADPKKVKFQDQPPKPRSFLSTIENDTEEVDLLEEFGITESREDSSPKKATLCHMVRAIKEGPLSNDKEQTKDPSNLFALKDFKWPSLSETPKAYTKPPAAIQKPKIQKTAPQEQKNKRITRSSWNGAKTLLELHKQTAEIDLSKKERRCSTNHITGEPLDRKDFNGRSLDMEASDLTYQVHRDRKPKDLRTRSKNRAKMDENAGRALEQNNKYKRSSKHKQNKNNAATNDKEQEHYTTKNASKYIYDSPRKAKMPEKSLYNFMNQNKPLLDTIDGKDPRPEKDPNQKILEETGKWDISSPSNLSHKFPKQESKRGPTAVKSIRKNSRTMKTRVSSFITIPKKAATLKVESSLMWNEFGITSDKDTYPSVFMTTPKKASSPKIRSSSPALDEFGLSTEEEEELNTFLKTTFDIEEETKKESHILADPKQPPNKEENNPPRQKEAFELEAWEKTTSIPLKFRENLVDIICPRIEAIIDEAVPGTDIAPGKECVIPFLMDKDGPRAIVVPFRQKTPYVADLRTFIKNGTLGFRMDNEENIDHVLDLLYHVGPLQREETEPFWTHTENLLIKHRAMSMQEHQNWLVANQEARKEILMEPSNGIQAVTIRDTKSWDKDAPWDPLIPMQEFKWAFERAVYDAINDTRWKMKNEESPNPLSPNKNWTKVMSYPASYPYGPPEWTEENEKWSWTRAYDSAWFPTFDGRPFWQQAPPWCNFPWYIPAKPSETWRIFEHPWDRDDPNENTRSDLPEPMRSKSRNVSPLKEQCTALQLKQLQMERIEKARLKRFNEFVIQKALNHQEALPPMTGVRRLTSDVTMFIQARERVVKTLTNVMTFHIPIREAEEQIQHMRMLEERNLLREEDKHRLPSGTPYSREEWRTKCERESIAPEDVQWGVTLFADDYKRVKIGDIFKAKYIRAWAEAIDESFAAEVNLKTNGLIPAMAVDLWKSFDEFDKKQDNKDLCFANMEERFEDICLATFEELPPSPERTLWKDDESLTISPPSPLNLETSKFDMESLDDSKAWVREILGSYDRTSPGKRTEEDDRKMPAVQTPERGWASIREQLMGDNESPNNFMKRHRMKNELVKEIKARTTPSKEPSQKESAMTSRKPHTLAFPVIDRRSNKGKMTPRALEDDLQAWNDTPKTQYLAERRRIKSNPPWPSEPPFLPLMPIWGRIGSGSFFQFSALIDTASTRSFICDLAIEELIDHCFDYRRFKDNALLAEMNIETHTYGLAGRRPVNKAVQVDMAFGHDSAPQMDQNGEYLEENLALVTCGIINFKFPGNTGPQFILGRDFIGQSLLNLYTRRVYDRVFTEYSLQLYPGKEIRIKAIESNKHNAPFMPDLPNNSAEVPLKRARLNRKPAKNERTTLSLAKSNSATSAIYWKRADPRKKPPFQDRPRAPWARHPANEKQMNGTSAETAVELSSGASDDSSENNNYSTPPFNRRSEASHTFMVSHRNNNNNNIDRTRASVISPYEIKICYGPVAGFDILTREEAYCAQRSEIPPGRFLVATNVSIPKVAMEDDLVIFIHPYTEFADIEKRSGISPTSGDLAILGGRLREQSTEEFQLLLAVHNRMSITRRIPKGVAFAWVKVARRTPDTPSSRASLLRNPNGDRMTEYNNRKSPHDPHDHTRRCSLSGQRWNIPEQRPRQPFASHKDTEWVSLKRHSGKRPRTPFEAWSKTQMKAIKANSPENPMYPSPPQPPRVSAPTFSSSTASAWLDRLLGQNRSVDIRQGYDMEQLEAPKAKKARSRPSPTKKKPPTKKKSPTKKAPPSKKEASPKQDQKKKQFPALLGVIRTLQVSPKKQQLPISLTELLPHLKLPIGPKCAHWSRNEYPTVSGIFDTGSGLTIGRLQYWEDVARLHPEFVEKFGPISEAPEDHIRVGGIEQEGDGATCSHYVLLRTPFTNKGEPVSIGIALTEELSCNLIFGLPLIIRAKMTANLWEKYVSSSVFNTTFPLEFHAPLARDTVSAQDGSIISLRAVVGRRQ